MRAARCSACRDYAEIMPRLCRDRGGGAPRASGSFAGGMRGSTKAGSLFWNGRPSASRSSSCGWRACIHSTTNRSFSSAVVQLYVVPECRACLHEVCAWAHG